IRTLGALVGAGAKAEALARSLAARLDAIAAPTHVARRPKVYFEEWDEPMISGIGWGSERIALAGRGGVFAGKARGPSAKERIVASEDVLAAAPDVILASWCGKKVVIEKIASRPGWDAIPAVRDKRIFEIKSPLILQPGPAALTDGLDAIVAALGRVIPD